MTIEWERRCDEALREEVWAARLPSGLCVSFLAKPGFQQKTAVLLVRYGALDGAWPPAEKGRPRRAPPGLAHFLEHRLFEGAEGDASERFAALGASCNASTGFTNTSFHFSCTDRFDDGLDILLGFLDGLHLAGDAVARERKIVAEEIRGAQDTADWVVWQRLMACLYVESDARFDIGGTLESLEAIDAEWLRAAYGAFYRPANAWLGVSGDLDPAALLERIARRPSEARDAGPSPWPGGVEPRRVAFRRSTVAMDVPQAKLCLGFKEAEPDGAGLPLARRGAETMAGLVALFGRSSDFFRENYESGLLDDSFQFQHTLEPGIGHVVFSADTDSPDSLVLAILERLERARREGVDPADLRRIRKVARGRFLRAFDHPEAAAFALAGHALHGVSLFEIPALIDGLSPESVDRRLREGLSAEAHAVSVVLPANAPRSAE